MCEHKWELIKEINTKMYADNLKVAESENIYRCNKCETTELVTVKNLDNLPDAMVANKEKESK